MATVRETLIAARALIAKGWTQGALARDADGRPIIWCREPDAGCWCPIGAVDATVLNEDEFDAAVRLLETAGDHGSLVDWNNAPGRTQAEVLALFDRAIERAGA